MTHLNLILILCGVGLLVFSVLGAIGQTGPYFENLDRLLGALGAVLLTWGIIRVRYKSN